MPVGDGRRKITEGKTISECELGSTIPQTFKMEQKRKRKSLQRQVFFRFSPSSPPQPPISWAQEVSYCALEYPPYHDGLKHPSQ